MAGSIITYKYDDEKETLEPYVSDSFIADNVVRIGASAWQGYKKYGRGCVFFYPTSCALNGEDTWHTAYEYRFVSRVELFNYLNDMYLNALSSFGLDFKNPTNAKRAKEIAAQHLAPVQCIDVYDPHKSVIMLIHDNYWSTEHLVTKHFVPEITPQNCHKEILLVEQSKKRNYAQKEKQLESDLYLWLISNGVAVEKQVKTNKHRLDLWIPNIGMIELKAERVSGDDVCQAIDYYSTYRCPVVLIGNGLSSSASRGIEGFNTTMGKDCIVFVTWSGAKPYFKGLLAL
jgi:hypothetical protein